MTLFMSTVPLTVLININAQITYTPYTMSLLNKRTVLYIQFLILWMKPSRVRRNTQWAGSWFMNIQWQNCWVSHEQSQIKKNCIKIKDRWVILRQQRPAYGVHNSSTGNTVTIKQTLRTECTDTLNLRKTGEGLKLEQFISTSSTGNTVTIKQTLRTECTDTLN